MEGNRIQYLSGQDVDREKWDRCIQNSSNGLIYSSRIYLDMMADQWNAIVINDYEAVMPLPWRKKYMIPYYYHVPFVPQAGITGKIDPLLFKEFTRILFKRVRYGDIFLNYGNTAYADFTHARPMTNLVLDLGDHYESLRSRYNKDAEKNLKKSVRNEPHYSASCKVKEAVHLFRKYYAGKMSSVRDIDFERFTCLVLHLQQNNLAFVRQATDDKGKLLAVALLLKDDRRIYNLMNTVLPEGRKNSANYFLFDNIIREFAGSKLLLDLEGSEIPGVKKFYANFGSTNQPYFYLANIPEIVKMMRW